jgi:hypothetical protein
MRRSTGTLYHEKFNFFEKNKVSSKKIQLFPLAYSPSFTVFETLVLTREQNRDSRRTFERGPSMVCSLGSLRRYTRFLACLGCSSRPSTKFFFSPPYGTLFQFLCPPHLPTSWAGNRAALLLNYASPWFIIRTLW